MGYAFSIGDLQPIIGTGFGPEKFGIEAFSRQILTIDDSAPFPIEFWQLIFLPPSLTALSKRYRSVSVGME